MAQVAAQAPVLAGEAARRGAAALAARKAPSPIDVAARRAELAKLLRDTRPEAGFA
jgi:hypothetical protein